MVIRRIITKTFNPSDIDISLRKGRAVGSWRIKEIACPIKIGWTAPETERGINKIKHKINNRRFRFAYPATAPSKRQSVSRDWGELLGEIRVVILT